jgi:hypothetical protein
LRISASFTIKKALLLVLYRFQSNRFPKCLNLLHFTLKNLPKILEKAAIELCSTEDSRRQSARLSFRNEVRGNNRTGGVVDRVEIDFGAIVRKERRQRRR